jgi:predicted DCC family thiol-disulfide oxidoreductase YuxK
MLDFAAAYNERVEERERMPGPGKFEILTDGACPFCQWTRARLEPFDTANRLRFLDYNDPELAAEAPFTREELDREMHVHAPDGAWSSGFAAWVVVLRALPPLAWLGWLLRSPLFRSAGPKLYRWVARNRYRLPGAPPPCGAAAYSRPDGHAS